MQPQMRLIFAKTKWEALELPLPEFLRRARGEEFSATEINISELSESPEEIRELHAAAGLELVAQILTAGATPSEHAASMRQLHRRAVECAPLIVNCHTGRDFFTFEERGCLGDQLLDAPLPLHGVFGNPGARSEARFRSVRLNFTFLPWLNRARSISAESRLPWAGQTSCSR
jgi:hypothetical protein